MKILFLHLTDIHCKDGSDLNNHKLEQMITSLNSLGDIDECILVISGDLAYSGAINEYKIVQKFIGTILSKLGKKFDSYINLLIVPGNHDINYGTSNRTSEDIIELFRSSKDMDGELEKEHRLMKNFWSYANSKKCFNYNKSCDVKTIKFGNFTIQANLINTAPFSTKKMDNKELHYFPENRLYALLNKNNADLVITVMHHSTEWFRWDSKNYLEDTLLKNSEIIFQGHEHVAKGVQHIENNKDGTIFSKGGEYSGIYTHESTFSTMVFNTTDFTIENTIFKWDKKESMFVKENSFGPHKVNKKNNEFQPNDDFLAQFYADNQNLTDDVTDYFVFPELNTKYKAQSEIRKKILDVDSFFNVLSEIKCINIIGKNNSGKSALLKYLYKISLERGFTPLYLGSDDYKSKKINKLLRDLFEEQYSEELVDFNRYDQLDKDKKIVFVDDFNNIKHVGSRDKLLEYLVNNVGYVILSTNEIFDVNLIEPVKNAIKYESDIGNYIISDFYKDKREELIIKVCELSSSKICRDDIDNLIRVVDAFVLKKFGLFSLTPDFIIQYIKFCLGQHAQERRGEGVFNLIFETNIRNSIIKYSHRSEVEDFMISLEEIAFYMHFNKSETISSTKIEEIINQYCEDYAIKIDIQKFMESSLKSKIIQGSNGSLKYEFSNRNLLSYFVAKKIYKLIERNGPDIEELHYILNNICFGINDTILLFLSYLRSNTKMVLNLCKEVNRILNPFEELNFDESNIRYLKKAQLDNISAPNSADRKAYKEHATERERNLQKEEEEIRYVSIYDYDESEIEKFPNNINRAIKYMEIISKSLVSQFSILNATEKTEIIDCIYKIPNMILYAILKKYDDNYDQIIDEIKGLLDVMEDVPNVEKEKIEKFFVSFSIALCLSLYDNIAFNSSDRKTLGLLNEFEMDNSNYLIMNLMLIENGDTTDGFIENFKRLMDNSEDLFLKQLAQLVARKHLMTRDALNHSQRSKLLESFSESSKKQILLSSFQKMKKVR